MIENIVLRHELNFVKQVQLSCVFSVSLCAEDVCIAEKMSIREGGSYVYGKLLAIAG